MIHDSIHPAIHHTVHAQKTIYDIWLCKYSIELQFYSDSGTAQMICVQPRKQPKLCFANHGKHSDVQHCLKSHTGPPVESKEHNKQTGGIICKKKSVVRCLCMSSWASLWIYHRTIHKLYVLLLCFFLGDGGNEMFKCFARVVFFGALA